MAVHVMLSIRQLLHTVRFDNYQFEAKVGEIFSTKNLETSKVHQSSYHFYV